MAVAFYGGSFNPPTLAHVAIVDHLLENPFFDQVIVKPCGVRSDKPELAKTNGLRVNRVEEMLIRTQKHYRLDLSGVHAPMVPTVQEWEALCLCYSNEDVYLVVGTDLFEDEGEGRCQVQRWIEGERLFREARFVIYPRPIKKEALFPKYAVHAEGFEPIDISSSQLRKLEGWT
jgi:nicotinate-nucleotide adenylyltransferase